MPAHSKHSQIFRHYTISSHRLRSEPEKHSGSAQDVPIPGRKAIETATKSRFEDLKSAGSLPSPGGVALEILRLSRRDDVRLPDIARVVKSDPALAGRLMQLANSAGAGQQRPALSVDEAITRVGLAAVRQAALGFSMLAANREGACAGFDYDGYWARALATGIAAQALARPTRAGAPEECFM